MAGIQSLGPEADRVLRPLGEVLTEVSEVFERSRHFPGVVNEVLDALDVDLRLESAKDAEVP